MNLKRREAAIILMATSALIFISLVFLYNLTQEFIFVIIAFIPAVIALLSGIMAIILYVRHNNETL